MLNVFLIPFTQLVMTVINLYVWAVIIFVLIGWLGRLGALNRNSPFILSFYTFLQRVVQPALFPLQRCIPSIKGFDPSPLFLIVLLYVLQGVLMAGFVRLILIME